MLEDVYKYIYIYIKYYIKLKLSTVILLPYTRFSYLFCSAFVNNCIDTVKLCATVRSKFRAGDISRTV